MNQPSLLRKGITCSVAGLVLAALLLVLGNSGNINWFPPTLVFSLVAMVLLLALLFPFVWQFKERRGNWDSTKIEAGLYTLIRYGIAFNLASFGWKKILGLQFVVPPAIAAQPMNQQSGEWLTWYYFGYSPAFGIILALIQITGSYLLLFRRTVLLGALMLFALMLNLSLINIFYQINAGALLQSLILTLGLLFLILQDYYRLRAFFLQAPAHLRAMDGLKPWAKHLVRLSVLLLSFLFTLYIKSLVN